MTAIVLVPGAWLGAWAWERVAPPLQSSGHTVFPVTLPGLSDRAHELTPEIGLMAHVADVLDLCRKQDLHGAILVGHSYAGAVVGAVARRAPERFRAQVYLDTMPLEEGACLLDGFGPAGRARFEAALTTSHGTRAWPMPEPLGAQAPVDGLTPADLDLLRRRGTPHPALSFEEHLSGPVSSGPYPKSLAISCVEDEKAAATERELFLKEHRDWSYHALFTGHWPMLSTPHALVSLLDQICRE
ncbi:MAG TPA: alpha/beta hydrolase family protein [Thermoplasmata archaeon]|nr:alpha/beta hydrolase family protein [Thermoplasmata archaeon]